MSLRKPSHKVEWTDNFTSWNNISSDLSELTMNVEDLSLGPWDFTLKLKNRQSKYSTTFPSVDGEKGLHYGFRFTINGKVIGLYRAVTMTPMFNEAVGDLYYVAGLGLGQEVFHKKTTENYYPRYKADNIIANQLSGAGLVDCSNLSSPFTAPRSTVVIGKAGKPTLKDMMVGLEEDVGYSCYFDSREKPAPCNFFSKTDTAKKLSLIVKNIIRDNSNNIIRGSEPRTIQSLINFLVAESYLDTEVYFRTSIPNDEDGWTESLSNVFGIHWSAIVGTLSADGDVKSKGDASIKCTTGWSGDKPKMRLIPANSMYGLAFSPDNEGVDHLNIMWRNTITAAAIQPRVSLTDDESHVIYQNFTKSDDAWSGRGFEVGTGAGGWSGDTGTFNWNIQYIDFEDTTGGTGEKTIWVDNLCFYDGDGYDDTYLQDSTSVTKYGRRDMEISLPAAYPFINMWQYGIDLLTKNKEPSRTFEIATKLDPALILEDDEVTSASLLPGWLLQVNVPRLGLKAVANGGCWWRILRTTYYLNTQPTGGLSIALLLMSTAAESPEDYSNLNAMRLIGMKDPARGNLMYLNSQDRQRGRQLSGVSW